MAENKSVSPKSILIFVIVLFAFVAALNMTVYFSSVKNTPPIAVQPTVTPIPNPSPTPTPTVKPTPAPPTVTPAIDISNWKTYRNEEYGYEFKYPSDYHVEDTKGTDYAKYKSVRIISPKKYFNEDWQVYVSYDITILSTIFSPDVQSLKSIMSANDWESEKTFLINGYNALLLGGFNGKYRDIVFIFTDKDTYAVDNHENFIEDHSKVFQGIL